MSQSRQLAAIMFTDIVGYTALMGKDEKKVFEKLNLAYRLYDFGLISIKVDKMLTR